MPNRRVEFELSIEKFSFKFKGDQETAEKLQGSVNHLLGAVSEAQSAVIAPESSPDVKLLPSANAEGATSTNKRSRSDDSGGRQRKVNTDGPKYLISLLLSEDFFRDARTAADIVSALAAKGHTFNSGQLATPLTRTVKSGALKRKNGTDGGWLYYKD